MSSAVADRKLLDHGTLSFSVESRILRELGERLVRQPDVAVLELVKNAYDADARSCLIEYDGSDSMRVDDDGSGMTFKRFVEGWMRIGTSSKEELRISGRYIRVITGEKGIGRFAVRSLGRVLRLVTIADDAERHIRTRLSADFDWKIFDKHEDLGKVQVPYRLEVVASDVPTGTSLVITDLAPAVAQIDFRAIKTGSMGILSPLRSMFQEIAEIDDEGRTTQDPDPGFVLRIRHGEEGTDSSDDVAAEILKGFALRAKVKLDVKKIDLKIYRRNDRRPYISIVEAYPNSITKLYADIRFFPRRKGAFVDLPVDGRMAYSWIAANSGVAVFDRRFRVHPYGKPSDDWLDLAADAARNRRDPRSSIAEKHFPMTPQERASTADNWMLRLPQSAQLVGLVQVEGQRTSDMGSEGLVAAADREGFISNETFRQLVDVVRGAIEAIAYVDRRLQQEEERAHQAALIASLRKETKSAINELQANPNISAADKARIITALAHTQELVERHEETARSREQQLEIMSLLGVVAGFMTHEFGVAVQELEEAHGELLALSRSQPRFKSVAEKFAGHIKALREFVTYSSAYIQGAKVKPEEAYPVRPRLQQVRRIFGKYAEDRNIDVEITADAGLLAPLVPAALYNGIALNLYTNALKAVTARLGKQHGLISFKAWNDSRWHFLEVADTGIGIPHALRERIFDPLFTTTDSRRDPLGSGMGLGLALVRRGVEAFGGRIEVVDPPPTFATCVRVRLPLETAD